MEQDAPQITHRPWGHFEVLPSLPGVPHQIKRLHVNPGSRLSLQSHRFRSELWCVVQGRAEATVGEEVKLLGYGDSVFIPVGTKHRLSNPGDLTLIVVEVQTGEAFDEHDIQRFQDDYAREA